MEIRLPFKEGPDWLDALVFSRIGDEIVIEAVRQSGTQLGEIRVSAEEFNALAVVLKVR